MFRRIILSTLLAAGLATGLALTPGTADAHPYPVRRQVQVVPCPVIPYHGGWGHRGHHYRHHR